MLASGHAVEERGIALIGADGLWSSLRKRMGHSAEPRFARHTAWRALAPSDKLEAELRKPAVNLLLGRHAHLVHYPVWRRQPREHCRNHPGRLARAGLEGARQPGRDSCPLSCGNVASPHAHSPGSAAAVAQMGALRLRAP